MTVEGQAAVLKVDWPHREARHEADGLGLWAGVGAVRVLKSDPSRWAMLLDRCIPGAALDEPGVGVQDALEAFVQGYLKACEDFAVSAEQKEAVSRRAGVGRRALRRVVPAGRSTRANQLRMHFEVPVDG